MNRVQIDGRRSQRGMTLIETIVAVAIFAIIFIAALMLFSAANRAYLQTDAATIQQQNVRFAMDRMMETMRDSGANYNALGRKTLPDEQIEAAYQSAVFVRGDFDNARETDLETGTYPIVTVGNDEIVGYVLRKPMVPGDTNNPITIRIKADFLPSSGRDAVIVNGTTINNEETMEVKVAATDVTGQRNPPYQLVRVTFNEAGAAQYEVIADNIYRLSFAYADASGNTVAAAGALDGTNNADRATRASIRRIDINLSGVSDRPDFGYKDASDTTSLSSYRKFTLAENVLGINLGKTGKKHNPVPAVNLNAPVSITVCTGHCRLFRVTWPASTSAGVSLYRVYVHADADAGLGLPAYDESFTADTTTYDFIQPTTTDTRDYTFSVAAASGSLSGPAGPSSPGIASSNHANSIPETPTNVNGSQSAGEYAMAVSWEPVTRNIGLIDDATCVSAGGPPSPTEPEPTWNGDFVDKGNYKIYRVRSDGTNDGDDATTDISDLAFGELDNVPSADEPFIDRTAAPCSAYFYRVQACDLCDETSGFSAAMGAPVAFALSDPAVTPGQPVNLRPVGTPGNIGGNWVVQMQWDPVTRTAGDDRAAAIHYVLERYRKLESDLGAFPSTPEWSSETIVADRIYETTTGPVQTFPIADAGGNDYTYRFIVRAVYDCSTPRPSIDSLPYDLSNCDPPPGNTLEVRSPADGTTFVRPDEGSISILLTANGPDWTSASLEILDEDNNVVTPEGTVTPVINARPSGGVYDFGTWDISGLEHGDGAYTLTFTGYTGSCRATVQSRIVLDTFVCGLELTNAAFQGNGSNVFTSMTFNITNNCTGQDLTITGLTAEWSGTNTTPKITQVATTSPNVTLYPTSSPQISNGGLIDFPTNDLTIAAGATSPTVTFTFSTNFTSNGTRTGTPGAFTRIIAHLSNGDDDDLITSNVP